MTEQEILKLRAQARLRLKAKAGGNSAEGMAKTVGSSAVKGVIGTLTAPLELGGMVYDAANAGMEKLYDKVMGNTPEERAEINARIAARDEAHLGISDFRDVLGTKPVTKAVEAVTGPLYEPKTQAEKYVGTGTEFAAGAGLLGGANKARMALQGAVAGLSSEAAGQATEGSKMEPYARAVGGLLGGLGAGAVDGMVSGARVPSLATQKAAAPTASQIKAASNAEYAAARSSGLKIKSNELAVSKATLVNNLRNEGFVSGPNGRVLNPKTTALMSQIDKNIRRGDIDFDEMMNLRQIANNAIEKTVDGKLTSDGRFALKITDTLDDFVDNLTPQQVSRGTAADIQEATTALERGRSMWARARRSETIDELLGNAELAASGKFTQAGMEHALRDRFRALLRNPRKRGYFSVQEQEAMRKVVEGGKFANAMRWLGKLSSSSSPISMAGGVGAAGALGAMAGAQFGNPMLGSALAAGGATLVGAGARRLAESSTIRHSDAAEILIRSGRQAMQKSPVVMEKLRQGVGAGAIGTAATSSPFGER